MRRIKDKYLIYNDKKEIVVIENKSSVHHGNRFILQIPTIIKEGKDIYGTQEYYKAIIDQVNPEDIKFLMSTCDKYDAQPFKKYNLQRANITNIRNFYICHKNIENIENFNFEMDGYEYRVHYLNTDKILELFSKNKIYSDENIESAIKVFVKR